MTRVKINLNKLLEKIKKLLAFKNQHLSNECALQFLEGHG